MELNLGLGLNMATAAGEELGEGVALGKGKVMAAGLFNEVVAMVHWLARGEASKVCWNQ